MCQLSSLKNENNGYTYVLVAVDVLSKYARVEPLRGKSLQTVATAFEKIFKRSNSRLPVYLQTDKGKEKNKTFLNIVAYASA